MRRPRIAWESILPQVPGLGIGERFFTGKGGRTYGEYGKELGVSESAVKSFAWKFGRADQLPERKRAVHVVQTRPRVNYAEILGAVIDELAQERDMDVERYRRMLKTQAGETEFRRRCLEIGMPVFECHYLPRRGNESEESK